MANVSHVINYDIPNTADTYIHRIGRTGRAARTGAAFTLITGEDAQMVRAIDRIIGEKIERRILPDFDYSAAATAEAPVQKASSRKPQTRKPAASRGKSPAKKQPVVSRKGGRLLGPDGAAMPFFASAAGKKRSR